MLKLITPPTEYPLTLNEVKTHLHIELGVTIEDAYLNILIGAATEYVQNYTNRQLMQATYELTVESLPATISLSRPPLQEITAVTVPGATVEENILLETGTHYTLSETEPALISGVRDSDWYNTDYENVKITYIAGYADAASVPASIKSAMLLIIGHLYTNREEVIVGTLNGVSKFASDALLNPYRIFYF